MYFDKYLTEASSELNSVVRYLKMQSGLLQLHGFSHSGIISETITESPKIWKGPPSADSAVASVCWRQSLLCGCQCLTVNSPAALIGNYRWRSHISSELKFQEKKKGLM